MGFLMRGMKPQLGAHDAEGMYFPDTAAHVVVFPTMADDYCIQVFYTISIAA